MSEPTSDKGTEPVQPYSASKHSVQGAGENVHEAKEAVGKATDSIKGLVSGKANMVDTALAVKGAIDNVKGLTGRLSATAMMPVMKALGAFKGKAILAAGKQMDPVMGIDVHMVTIPPSPAPVPLPHPYIGILFNAKDWVSCAINTFKKDIMDAVPAPAEDDKGTMASIAKNKEAIVGIAMGLAGMSASVKFGDFVPRAITGTPVKCVPHIPMGAGFHPGFAASVAKNHGKAFLGSLFVVADGDPMVGSFHLNYDCWDVGVVDLFKSRRNSAKKSPPAGGPLAELFVPSGTVMPIPWGRPVLVNSIPTPINPMNILDRVFKAGLGKLKKAGRGAVQKAINKAANSKAGKKVGCKVWTAVSKAIGTGQSHPVDVSGGYFFTDIEDFSLPGPIPVVWEPTWYSFSDYQGPLGYGWHHSYDIALSFDPEMNVAVVRMSDGRPAAFDIPLPGFPSHNRNEKLSLYIHESGYYYSIDEEGLMYRFTQKEYNNPYSKTQTHLLQSISNYNGFSIQFMYNQDGLLLQIIDSSNRKLTVLHDTQGRIVSIQAPHPQVLGKTFAIARYAYADSGDMIRHTDALDQQMHFIYENHLIVKEVWRNGLTWQFRYNKPAGTDVKCTEVWGDNNLLHYKFDYSDPLCTVVTNSLGFKKLFFHKNGVVTKYVDPVGSIWQFRYNRYNDLEWETDPLGNQEMYTRDEWGNTVTSTDPASGFVQTEFSKPGFSWLPTLQIDESGGKWRWEYDKLGNLVESIDPLNIKTQYIYLNGLLTELIHADGARVLFQYDKDYNLNYVRTENGAITRFTYDALGNCLEVTNPNNKTKRRTFDLLGRIVRSQDFDGNIINLEYDGLDNVVHYSDNLTDIYCKYHGICQLASITEAGATIYYNYDTEEQLRRIVNEHGVTYTFDLDAAGNVIEEKSFDNVILRYDYDAAGRIRQINRPSGKFTRYTYDPCDRIIQVQYSDDTKEEYTFRKDGELLKAVNEFVSVEYEKDIMGSILKETVNGEWVASAFDHVGNRLKVTSSLGANILHHYNKMGDVIQLKANNWQAEFDHDLLGMEIERSLPGGVISQWKRNGIGNPVSHFVSQPSNKSLTRTRSKQYVWDVDDRVKQIRDHKGVTRFIHDAWSNLSKTIYPDGEVQFRNPDAVGNLYKTETRNDRNYKPGGRLRKSMGWEYFYDDEGNLAEKKHISGDTWKYEWNLAGLLSKVIRPDKSEVSYIYDALERRYYKKFNNTVTKFIWDGDLLLHEWKEHAITGEKLSDLQVGQNGTVTWIYDNDSFTPAAKLKGDKSYSIITDHLGTASQMYNELGELMWECELDSYGKPRMEEGELSSCPFRYEGQYEDVETGLYYNRFRYYAPEEGVYLSRDPIGLCGSLALYGYVTDTNVWIDPFGLATCKRQRVGQKLKGWKGPVDYSKIKNPKTAGPGKEFTASQKKEIYAKNRKRNGGYLVSDEDGTILKPPKKSKSGVKPSPHEAQVDHKNAKSKGGTNKGRNAAVLSRKQNRAKSNKRKKKTT